MPSMEMPIWLTAMSSDALSMLRRTLLAPRFPCLASASKRLRRLATIAYSAETKKAVPRTSRMLVTRIPSGLLSMLHAIVALGWGLEKMWTRLGLESHLLQTHSTIFLETANGFAF